MKMLIYSTKDFERKAFNDALQEMDLANLIEISFTNANLTLETVALAAGFSAICLFVTDLANKECLQRLKEQGIKVLLLRSAGFNHIDCKAANELDLTVLRVPRYSPEAVAEFTVGLYLCLNRKIHRAHDRVKEGNFSIDGLMGHTVSGQTVGVVGTGNIGKCVAQIFRGFGAQVLAFDLSPDIPWANSNNIRYLDFQNLLKSSDVITLHIPLMPTTKHILNTKAFLQMKSQAYIVNTSRGGLVDTEALIYALKQKKLGGAALDVYEEEEHIFFKDLSDEIIADDRFSVLSSFPNVLVTSPQAFLTHEAVTQIVHTTFENAIDWLQKKPLVNAVHDITLQDIKIKDLRMEIGNENKSLIEN